MLVALLLVIFCDDLDGVSLPTKALQYGKLVFLLGFGSSATEPRIRSSSTGVEPVRLGPAWISGAVFIYQAHSRSSWPARGRIESSRQSTGLATSRQVWGDRRSGRSRLIVRPNLVRSRVSAGQIEGTPVRRGTAGHDSL